MPFILGRLYDLSKEEDVMSKMISRCGLVCTECPAYLATQANDEQKAKETAALWTKMYNTEVKIEDVWCDGCLVEGKKCVHCGECEIRACVIERKLDNCAHCADYGCDKISGFFQMVPDAKSTLDQIRKNL
jgi:uncharacterized protein DUF3795